MAFVLSENMQQIEGSQLEASKESPTKMQPIIDNLPSGDVNPTNREGGYVGYVSNLTSDEYTNNTDISCLHQQPETLNLPAVLWDKPVGSKIRVPPPVPPRSPRRPIDPVSSGAFEAAMDMPYDGGLSQANIAPQRGLHIEMFAFHLL